MFKIEIVNKSTDEVVETMTAKSRRGADRIEDGVLINLDHDRFFVRTTESDQ